MCEKIIWFLGLMHALHVFSMPCLILVLFFLVCDRGKG